MKKIIFYIILSAVYISAANAKTLVCESKEDQTLYFTEGQLVLFADVKNETIIKKSNLSFRPELKFGSVDNEVIGVKARNWVRFQLEGDAWCSYKLVLPVGFHRSIRPFRAIVDAICEENSNSSIWMSCRLQ